MPRRRRPGGRPEMLSRNVEFKSFRISVRLSASHPRKQEPFIESQPWLELRGVALEPVWDVTDVVVSMYPRDKVEVGTARPASVGAIIQARPHLRFVITWPQLILTASGRWRWVAG